MKYRIAQLLASEDLGASGTKVININTDQVISRIEFTFKTTKASQGMSAGAPANIPRIELVDGSNKLHSLTGYENQALAYYNRKAVSMDHGQHVSTLSEVDTYGIDFGRSLWDKQLAFDPKKFSNPQLKIQWNEATADTSVTANALEVFMYMFEEENVSPMGFLQAIEHYDYTLGADNSYEEILLPDDHMIRQILVRAFQQGYEPWYSIDEARFDENNQQRTLFEYTDLEMYYRRMKSNWQMIQQQVVLAPGTSGNTYYLPMTDYNAAISLIGMGGTSEAYMTNASCRGGYFALTNSVAVNMAGIALGYLPWHCYQFPLGVQEDPEDWYDPAGKKPRLRLRASTGATSSTGQVVVEQVHKY